MLPAIQYREVFLVSYSPQEDLSLLLFLKKNKKTKTNQPNKTQKPEKQQNKQPPKKPSTNKQKTKKPKPRYIKILSYLLKL